MQFSNFTRIEEGNKITFTNSAPLLGVTNIKYYKDNSSGSFSKKEFRWSFNADYWSSWTKLTQSALSNFEIKGSNIFLEIRYLSSGSGEVTAFTLNYDGAAQSTTSEGTCPPDSKYVSVDKSIQAEVYDATNQCNVNDNTLVDAQTLCGKSCDYYLWRPNHKGEQPIASITDLQRILNGLSYAIQNVDIEDAANVNGDGIGVYFNKEDKVLYFKTLIPGNKTFITEDGDGHITIDMDDASINELYQLLGNFNGTNVGGGPGEIFKERTGDNLEFRTIAAGNANVVVTTVGDQVRISLDASVSGAPIWSDPDPVSADVGGITGPYTIDTSSNSIDILEKILYEYFPLDVSAELIPPADIYYEKWVDSFSIDVSGTFNNDSFVKSKTYDASLYINGIGDAAFPPISYSNVNNGNFHWHDPSPPFTAGWDDINYTVKIYHKVNSIDMEPTETSATIKFVEPYYYGTVQNSVNASNITAGDIQGLSSLIVPDQSNDIDFDVSANYQKIKFVYAYPNSYGDIKSIFDVKNDFNVTTSFDTSVVDLTIGASSPIPYKVYIKSHWISFTPDVSIFKLNFNI